MQDAICPYVPVDATMVRRYYTFIAVRHHETAALVPACTHTKQGAGVSQNTDEFKAGKRAVKGAQHIPVFVRGRRLNSTPTQHVDTQQARELVDAGLAQWCNRTTAIRIVKDEPRLAA